MASDRTIAKQHGKVTRTILSAWAWFALAGSVVVMFPVIAVVRLVTAPFDPARYWAGLAFRKVAVIASTLNPMWKFTVSGPIPDNPRNPYVVVANHESFVDILLISHLPFEMKWLSKDQFFKFPLVGWEMTMAGDIKLSRGSAKSRAKAMVDMRDRLAKRVSVMVFPEGTRSKTGELGEFHEGAFRAAVQAGVPVLPLVVVGTRSALVKHDWRFGFSEAEVRVLPPVSTDGLTKSDVADLTARVRASIAAARLEMAAERGLDTSDGHAAVPEAHRPSTGDV